MTIAKLILAGLLFAISIPCQATDSVTVSYESGFPAAGQSSEDARVTVSRSGFRIGEPAAIDQFFDVAHQLARELETHQICRSRAPGSSRVVVRIQLEGKSVAVACDVIGKKLQPSPDASPEELKVTASFERLINLTVERARLLITK